MTTNLFAPSASPGLKLVASSVCTSANATWAAHSGINLSITKRYKIVMQLTCSGSTDINMIVNGDATATNYWNERVNLETTVYSAAASNTPLISYGVGAAQMRFIDGELMFDATGIPFFYGKGTAGAAANVRFSLQSWAKSAAVASITSISFTVASGTISTGSRCDIYEYFY